jgi:hypothetical protein
MPPSAHSASAALAIAATRDSGDFATWVHTDSGAMLLMRGSRAECLKAAAALVRDLGNRGAVVSGSIIRGSWIISGGADWLGLGTVSGVGVGRWVSLDPAA